MTQIISYIPYDFSSCARLMSREETDLIIIIRPPTNAENLQQDIRYPITKIVRHVDNVQTNRPFIGTILYRYFPSGKGDAEIQEISTLLLHQFTHILGFNKTILNSKNLYISRSVKNRMNNNYKTKLFFIGSEVIKTAKNYFGCNSLSSLNGIELDDSNGDEVDDGHSIHWSERILMGDYHLFKNFL